MTEPPEQGDLVWLEFLPQAGHEQSGHRPALVLSSKVFNAGSSFAVVCPITSRVRGNAFEVRLPSGLPITGVVLSAQVKSLEGGRGSWK